MKIKDGYNGKECEVRICGNPNGSIELWLVQNGLPDTPEFMRYRETLSYMTLTELHALKKEIEEAVKLVFNL